MTSIFMYIYYLLDNVSIVEIIIDIEIYNQLGSTVMI